MGFLGSDALCEASTKIKKQLEVMPILRTAARFAIAARAEEKNRISSSMETGLPLVIATSNPVQLEMIAKDRGIQLADIVKFGGAVEAALDDDPDIDAVFDIVSSGRTLAANNLEIVADNLQTIFIVNAWKKPGV